MTQKSVSISIFDKFEDSIRKDELFNGIVEEFVAIVRKNKPNKYSIQKVMEKTQDEN